MRSVYPSSKNSAFLWKLAVWYRQSSRKVERLPEKTKPKQNRNLSLSETSGWWVRAVLWPPLPSDSPSHRGFPPIELASEKDPLALSSLGTATAVLLFLIVSFMIFKITIPGRKKNSDASWELQESQASEGPADLEWH